MQNGNATMAHFSQTHKCNSITHKFLQKMTTIFDIIDFTLSIYTLFKSVFISQTSSIVIINEIHPLFKHVNCIMDKQTNRTC